MLLGPSGLPLNPETMLFDGIWRNGASLPARVQKLSEVS